MTETYVSHGFDSYVKSALMKAGSFWLTKRQDPPQHCGCVDFSLRRYEWRTSMKSP